MKFGSKTHQKGSALLGPILSVCTCAPWLLACESQVIVDDGTQPGEEGECTSCQEELPPYEGTGECAVGDEEVRAEYERWARSPNLLGNLPPGAWEGTIAGTSALLRVGTDFSVSLLVGTPSPMDAEIGPFCQGSAVPYECGAMFSEGGVYPIHGAEWAPGELSFSLKRTMIYDEWCKLQSPTTEGWGSECNFGPYANVAINQTSPGVCSTGEDGEEMEPMDCGRLQLLLYGPVCVCASDGCFVDLQADEDAFPISLQTSDAGSTFEGEGPDGQAMLFTRVD